MAIDVELPELGESVVEGTVTQWLVKEGQRVEIDQPLVDKWLDAGADITHYRCSPSAAPRHVKSTAKSEA